MQLNRCRIGAMVVLAVAPLLAGPLAMGDESAEWSFQQFLPSGTYAFMDQRGFQPPISERDLKSAADALGLDASQREALTDLHRSLIDEFKEEWVAHRESSVDAQLRMEGESGDGTDWAAQMVVQMDQRTAFQARQDELVESLFTDLRLLLTPEQEKRWPSVERDRRRATTLGALALHDEEALDLVSIAKGLDLTPEQRAALAPVLERYADELDGVLSARNRAAKELGEKAAVVYRAQQGSQALWRTDPNKAQEMMTEQQSTQQELVPMCLSVRDACDKVRDLNRAYIRELEPVIPESAREEWERAVSAKRESPFGAFMNMSRAAMSIRMIENLEGQMSAFSTMLGDEAEGMEMVRIMRSAEPLTPDQRERIADLREHHEARMQEIKEKHRPQGAKAEEAATVSLRTPTGTVVIQRVDAANAGGQFGFFGMEQPDPEEVKETRALDLETLQELRGILTLNQRAAICMW